MITREEIIENLKTVHDRIEAACKKSGRNPGEIRLLLATKTVSACNIRVALSAGESLIGENKVQELKQKSDDLKDIDHETHFIGHLQTNKIKDVLRYATCIQSVDRIELAEKLDHRLAFEGRSMDVLLQFNTSHEESKFGMDPTNAIAFATQVAAFKHLRILGLMTIGLFSAETEKVRKCFRVLKEIQQQITGLELPDVKMDILSMGMSGDLETAIEEGSTMVRVGTAIFGKRKYPDSYYWNEQQKVV